MNNNFYQIAAIAGLSAMAVVPAQIAYAQNTTTTLTVASTFGCGGHSEGWCKVMVQSTNGNNYLVWYDNQLDVVAGDGLILTYETNSDGSVYSWNQLSNPVNGMQANVSKYLKVQP